MEPLSRGIVTRYFIAMAFVAALLIWVSVNEEGGSAAIPAQTAFWTVAIFIGTAQMFLISRGVRASLDTSRWPGWMLLIATALLGAIPITFEVRFLVEHIVAPPNGLPPPWLTYLNVTVINIVFSLIQYVFIERWPLASGNRLGFAAPVQTPAAAGDAPREQGPPPVGMLSRRPDGLNGVILHMQMEDHYLRVRTDHGEGLVLHRMSDAQRELAGSDGKQVHKSWWVSASTIARIRNENRKRTIIAKDGTEIPVGRSFEKALRESGWI